MKILDASKSLRRTRDARHFPQTDRGSVNSYQPTARMGGDRGRTARRFLADDQLATQGAAALSSNPEALSSNLAGLTSNPTALDSNLSPSEDPLNDPRQQALIYYLDRERWLELGVVIFRQYFDTARWMADQLAKR